VIDFVRKVYDKQLVDGPLRSWPSDKSSDKSSDK
jgi:hypothetical protein